MHLQRVTLSLALDIKQSPSTWVRDAAATYVSPAATDFLSYHRITCQTDTQANMRGVRYLVTGILVVASIVTYINRTNLNIAIVDMTVKHDLGANVSGCPLPSVDPWSEGNETTSTTTTTTTLPPVSTHAYRMMVITSSGVGDEGGGGGGSGSDKKYDWDQSTQGTVLGSFFYTYFLFQVPSGMLAERFGGKYVVLAGAIGSFIGSLLTPFVTDLHVSVICILRALMGMCQAGFFPASFGIACKWMPLKERSTAFAIIEVGSNIGSVLTFYAAGHIINSYGWPVLFYFAAGASGIMALVLAFVIRNDPKNHPCIDQLELDHIEANQPESEAMREVVTSDHISEDGEKKRKAPAKVPWIGILTNVPVIAALTFKFAYIWMFSLFYLEMPKYLHEVQHENIVDNGQANAIFNILATISVTSTGFLSDQVISRGWLGRTMTRKVFALFNGFGYALVVACIPIVGCNITHVKALIYVSALLQGFNAGSSIPIDSEMSRNFPSLLYSIRNMAAMSTGFLVPFFVGRVLQTIDDQVYGWNVIFFTSSGILAAATLFYLACAKAERQDFDILPHEMDNVSRSQQQE